MMEEEEETLFDQEGLLGDKSTDNEQSERRRKLYKTGALTAAFFSLGCCVAIPGATLLDLGERVGKDTEHMTFIAIARSAGYLIGSVFGGILSDVFDHQLVMFYTLALTSMATAVIPWCTVLYTLTGMIGVQGIALGVLDTGGNVFCIRIWGKKSPPYMQFLHFSFAIGAFLAPLIAHPFLLNSISEFSSNSTVNGNVSLKAILPYATSEHFSGERVKRDMTLLNNGHSDEWNNPHHSLFHSFKHRREATSNVTDSLNKTGLIDNSSLTNDSHTSTVPQLTTARPKKPEVVNPLSKEHASSQLVNDKLKDLAKNPITGEEDSEAENKAEGDQPEVVTNSNPTIRGDFDSGAGRMDNGTKSENGSRADLPNTPSNLTTSSSTSTSTTTTTTPTTSTLTTTTTPTTTTATTTTSTTSVTKKPTEKASTSDAPDASKIDANNSSQSDNSTDLNKSETWGDLVYDMLDTMRHMSKIQFAYIIIGFFLIANAGFFLSLYCKDRLGGVRIPSISHVDLTRPPDTTCFIGTLLCLLFVFFLFYVGMEQTYGILLTTFALEYPKTIWTPAQAATLTAAFWGCVALGRGISICMSRFFKAPCMLVSNLVLTLVGALLLSFGLSTSWVILWVGTVLLGLGMSSLFPTTISWTDSYYPLTGKAAAVFVAGSGVGQMTIPVLTGYLYQNVDRMCLMYVVCALSILLCIIYTFLQVLVLKRSQSGNVSRSYSGFMRLNTSENVADVEDSLDMDLIQAGGMDAPMRRRVGKKEKEEEGSHAKENGVSGEYEVTEFSKLVELSD